MENARVYLSLIIPAYNEAGHLRATLRTAREYFEKQTYSAEIIVVDDGSTDGTADVAQATLDDVRVISYQPNRGKGHAVKTGMLAATGDYRVFYDADASTPIDQLEKLWPQFEAGADIVIGSRSMPGSQVEIHQSWMRENMGRAFNRLLRMFNLTSFPDTQCGFKGFTAAACEVVFPRQTINGFAFDAELLFIAIKHGLRVEQVPVKWINCPDSSVHVATDAPRMLAELLTIRAKNARGLYE